MNDLLERQVDAPELIASGVTTQPVETVIAVLAASRDGASINAAARATATPAQVAKYLHTTVNSLA
jgi:hypothetical protein